MKKGIFRNFGKVFRFTYKNQLNSGVYKLVTIIFALIFLIVPMAIMPIADSVHSANVKKEKKPLPEINAKEIFFVNGLSDSRENLADGSLHYSLLNSIGTQYYNEFEYSEYDDLDTALSYAKDKNDSLVVFINGNLKDEENKDGAYANVEVLLPENTVLTKKDAENYMKFLSSNSQTLLLISSGLNKNAILQLMLSTTFDTYSATGYEKGIDLLQEKVYENSVEDAGNSVADVLKSVFPYVNLMLIYFMVLFYAQGVAMNVMLEKSSKLMDSFLTCIRPEALILGKLLAMVTAAVTQIAVWALSLIGGFAGGYFITLGINPDSDMILILFFRNLGKIGEGMFTVQGFVLSLLFLFAGFLMYCSISSISGAVSEKREDMSSTSTIYTLIILISFLLCLYNGGMSADITKRWLLYVPFTSIFLVPGNLLIGTLSLTDGLFSLLIMLITALIMVIAAGKIYKAMSLYKGNVPGIKKIISILIH